MDQLKRIFTMLGSPNEIEWPVRRLSQIRATSDFQGFTALPDYHDMSGLPKQNWQSIIASLGQDGIDLVVDLLRLGPTRRPSAIQVSYQHLSQTDLQALRHPYFSSMPRPTAPKKLPKPVAELRPRAIAPDEVQGKPLASGGMKRKAESPVPESGGINHRPIARKLFA